MHSFYVLESLVNFNSVEEDICRLETYDLVLWREKDLTFFTRKVKVMVAGGDHLRFEFCDMIHRVDLLGDLLDREVYRVSLEHD